MVNDAHCRVVLFSTPIGRGGEASEVASIAFFPPSDGASVIVGPTLYSDGARLSLSYTVPVND
jgi:glucose 1-dehydrogenase